jgi:cysteine desulfurase
MTSERIYVDHAATTPVRDDVLAAMLPYFGDVGFNASSLHAEGRATRAALDGARASVARLLGAKPREIVFTGGGSEADNLAILGAARARRGAGRHVVTAATEHHAVLHAMDVLREDGFEITVLPVDGDGAIDARRFADALRPGTVLASLMLANNELGTVHPVAELARLARAHGVLFHTDAVQAPGRIELDVAALGVDLLALSAHKFYGPKGVGALYVRSGTPLQPLVVGGGQEAGLRAGTENVAGIVGFARALELATEELPAETARLARMRDRFEREILAAVPGARVNAGGAPRLPSVASIAFAGIDAPTLLIRLDLEGVAVSAGSACAAGSTEPSHVIAALGAPAWVQAGTIRFSFGKLTREQDVERLTSMLSRAVGALRVAGEVLGTSHCDPLAGRPEVSL